MKKVYLRTIAPLADSLTPDDNFFTTHPYIVSEEDIIFEPLPAWKLQRQLPSTYQNTEVSRFMRRGIWYPWRYQPRISIPVSPKPFPKPPPPPPAPVLPPPPPPVPPETIAAEQTAKSYAKACSELGTLIVEVFKTAMQGMKATRAARMNDILQDLKDRTAITISNPSDTSIDNILRLNQPQLGECSKDSTSTSNITAVLQSKIENSYTSKAWKGYISTENEFENDITAQKLGSSSTNPSNCEGIGWWTSYVKTGAPTFLSTLYATLRSIKDQALTELSPSGTLAAEIMTLVWEKQGNTKNFENVESKFQAFIDDANIKGKLPDKGNWNVAVASFTQDVKNTLYSKIQALVAIHDANLPNSEVYAKDIQEKVDSARLLDGSPVSNDSKYRLTTLIDEAKKGNAPSTTGVDDVLSGIPSTTISEIQILFTKLAQAAIEEEASAANSLNDNDFSTTAYKPCPCGIYVPSYKFTGTVDENQRLKPANYECPSIDSDVILDRYISIIPTDPSQTDKNKQEDIGRKPAGMVFVADLRLVASQFGSSYGPSYRVIVVNDASVSAKGILSLYQRLVPSMYLYDYDIIIDTVSSYWPDVPIISGKNVVIHAPKLKAIGPVHYSQKYREIYKLEQSGSLKPTDFHLTSLYLNYYPSVERQAICEPSIIYNKGYRGQQAQFRECFGCQYPSACEFLIFQMDYYPKTATSSQGFDLSQIISKRIVTAFTTDSVNAIKASLCDTLVEINKEASPSLNDNYLIATNIAISSCEAWNIVKSTTCDDDSSTSTNNADLQKLSSFTISHFSSTDRLLCSIDSLDLRCIFSQAPIGASSQNLVKILFYTENTFYISLTQNILDSPFSTDSQLPSTTAIVLSSTASGAGSGFLSKFKSLKRVQACFTTRATAKLCTEDIKKCNPCQLGNYAQPCYDDPCTSHINTVPCTGHGLCRNGRCYCDSKFKGIDCSIPKCSSSPGILPCSGTGYCNYFSGQCVCRNPTNGANCDTCETHLDCQNGGLCTEGKCKCSHLYGGVLCQYRFVSIRYAVRPYVNRLSYAVEKILLKPFMISEPVVSGLIALASALEITALEISLYRPRSSTESTYISSLPPYMLYGMQNLRFLNISGLVEERFSFHEMLNSGRVFDTVKNLKTLVVSENQTICADNYDRYSLRGLNVWMTRCEDNNEACKSNILARGPFALEIYSSYGSMGQDFRNVPLKSTFWVPRDDVSNKTYAETDVLVYQRRWKDSPGIEVGQFLVQSKRRRRANVPKKLYSTDLARRNYLAISANVAFLVGEIRLQTLQLTASISSTTGSSTTRTLIAGSHILSGDSYGFGTFEIQFKFEALSCSHSPVFWLIADRSTDDPSFENYHPDCLGAIQLFGLNADNFIAHSPSSNSASTPMCTAKGTDSSFNFVSAGSGSQDLLKYYEPALEFPATSNTCVKKDLKTPTGPCLFATQAGKGSGTAAFDFVKCTEATYSCSVGEQIGKLPKTSTSGKVCRVKADTSNPSHIYQPSGNVAEAFKVAQNAKVTMKIRAVVTNLGVAIYYMVLSEKTKSFDIMSQSSASGTSTSFDNFAGTRGSTNSGSLSSFTGQLVLLSHASETVKMPIVPYKLMAGLYPLTSESMADAPINAIDEATLKAATTSYTPSATDQQNTGYMQIQDVSYSPTCLSSQTTIYLVVSHNFNSNTEHQGLPSTLPNTGAEGIATGGVTQISSSTDITTALKLSWFRDFLEAREISYSIYFDISRLPPTSSTSSKVASQACEIAFVPTTGQSQLLQKPDSGRLMYEYQIDPELQDSTLTEENFQRGLLAIGLVYNHDVNLATVSAQSNDPPSTGCGSPLCQ